MSKMQKTIKNKKTVLVTGATGFLGKRLVQRLLELSKDEAHPNTYDVEFIGRKIALGKSLEANELCGARFVALDLGNNANESEIEKLVQGKNFVIHCAALCELWGPYEEFYASNYLSTKLLADAFIKCNHYLDDRREEYASNRFIFISTPSVYTMCYEDRFNLTEDSFIAAPEDQVNYYSQTKRMAELLMQEYYEKHKINIITLRPRGIFGEGDTTLTPKLLSKLHNNQMVRVGPNWRCITNEITHVDNVVESILCSLFATSAAQGRFYTITNGDDHSQIKLYSLLENMARIILKRGEAYKIEQETRQVSATLLYFFAFLFETVYMVLLKLGISRAEPPITRYTANLLSTSSTFDISRAKKELNYKPRVSLQDGLQRTFAYFSKL